jgi:hypothetical protein
MIEALRNSCQYSLFLDTRLDSKFGLTESVFSKTVHSVFTSGRKCFSDGSELERPANPREASRICLQKLRLNHYATKSREEWRRKQARMAIANLPEGVRAFYTEEVRGFDARNQLTNAFGGFSLSGYAGLVSELLRLIGG